jgi:hypothetical protein
MMEKSARGHDAERVRRVKFPFFSHHRPFLDFMVLDRRH